MNRKGRRAAASKRAKIQPTAVSNTGETIFVRTLDGRPFHEATAIFPIFMKIGDDDAVTVGTGFYITRFGHFLTARHVLDEIDQSERREGFMVHLLDDDQNAIFRTVTMFSYSKEADVALGTLDHPPGYVFNKVPKLTTNCPMIGHPIVTVGYDKDTMVSPESIHVGPKYISGKFEEYLPTGRDRVMLPFPCYRSSMMMPGGASGGPVFDVHGHVFGINCANFEGTDISHLARIADVLDLTAHGMKFGPNEDPVDRTLRQLIDSRHVILRN